MQIKWALENFFIFLRFFILAKTIEAFKAAASVQSFDNATKAAAAAAKIIKDEIKHANTKTYQAEQAKNAAVKSAAQAVKAKNTAEQAATQAKAKRVNIGIFFH